MFRAQNVAPYFFILPFYIVFMTFSFIPILRAFQISFTDWQGMRGGSWVGLDNYDLLLNDPSFWQSLRNTVTLWIIATPILTFGSLFLAVVLNQAWLRGRYLLRLAFLLPIVTSLVVSGLAFLLLLDPDYGPLGVVTEFLGLEPLNIKVDTRAAIPALVMITVWRWLGWNMVIMLAGLQTLSQEVLEASVVDGAGFFRRLWYIILPMMRPIIVFATVLSTIGMFNLFDEPFMLFGGSGGPQQSGLLLGPYLYRIGFERFNFGYASAMAYVIAAMIFVMSLAQVYYTARLERDA